MSHLRLSILLLISFLVMVLGLGEVAVAQDQGASSFSPPAPTSVTTTASELEILTVPMTADDLSELAVIWQNHVKSVLEDIAGLNLELAIAEGAREEVLRDELAKTFGLQSMVQDSYGAVLDAWRTKGALIEDIQVHDTYLNALRLEAVRTTDLRSLLQLAASWLASAEGGLGFLLKVAGFLVALWGMYFVARVLRRAVSRGLSRVPNLSRLLQRFIVNVVYWATFVLGVLVVLGAFGVNVTPLFAIFGGLSFILGFAMQDTLGNLASGLMIMIMKPFDTGDYIEVGGASGFVDEMSVVSTQIRTFDNQIIIVPNSKIWGDVITNVSVSPERRVDLVFGIGYSDNAEHAIEVLKGLVAAHAKCLESPAPEIFVGQLGDSSVNIYCRPWTKSEDYWTVYWDLTGQAKERFDQEGISIPFPQRDVHLIQGENAGSIVATT